MTNKMTNKVALTVAIDVLGADAQYTEVVEKLSKMLAQVEKKNSAEKKPTKTQTENASLKDAILASMEVGSKYTITDIMNHCEAVADLSNQRVSALVRQLKESGELIREEIKRKAYFSLSLED